LEERFGFYPIVNHLCGVIHRKIMSVPTFLMVIMQEDAHPIVREDDYSRRFSGMRSA